MKNKKTFKTALNSIAFIAILMSLLMLLIHIIGSSWTILDKDFSYFYLIVGDLDDSTIVMNWSFAALYLTFMLVALVAWGLEFGLYNVPCFIKGGQLSGVKLFCKILIGLGIVVAMIGLLLPMGHSGKDILMDSVCPAWNIANVLSWIGIPLAFGATLAHAGVGLVK